MHLIHHAVLVLQQLSGDLNGVLEVDVKTLNFIKARLFKAQLFLCLCNKLGADHNNLLWLYLRFYCSKVAFQRQSSFTRVQIEKQNLHNFKRKPCACYYL